MSIILTAATNNELSPTIEWLKDVKRFSNISFLVTGIGCSITTYNLTKMLCENRPGLIIQAGIAGTYNTGIAPGSTVIIKEDVFADLGAPENDGFTDVFDLGLMAVDESPFAKKLLINNNLERYSKYNLKFVRGATVNSISCSPAEVSRITEKYEPEIESMEGAALHYVGLMENIPFLQLRSVSNFAGERNKKNWKIKESIKNLNKELQIILEDIHQQYQ